MRTFDHFHNLHHQRRVEEMYVEHTGGILYRMAKTGANNVGTVAGIDAVCRSNLVQSLQGFDLDIQNIGHGVDIIRSACPAAA